MGIIQKIDFDYETGTEKLLWCIGWIKRGMGGSLYTHPNLRPVSAVDEETAVKITLSTTQTKELKDAYRAYISLRESCDPKLQALKSIHEELKHDRPDIELIKVLVEPFGDTE